MTITESYEYRYETRQPHWGNGEIIEKAVSTENMLGQIVHMAKLRLLAELHWRYPKSFDLEDMRNLSIEVARQIAAESSDAISQVWLFDA